MELQKIWTLRGANRWAHVPVLEVEVTESTHPGTAEELARRTIELQRQAGSPVEYFQLAPLPGISGIRVIVEFEEEELARACLVAAYESLCDPTNFDCAASLAKLKDLAHSVRLGPSTAAIVRAALARNIPFRRLGSGSLVVLGHATKQRRVCTAETDATSAIAETIAQDKDLTRSLLRAVGVSVPEGRPVRDAEDAWNAAEDLGLPVVVKPRYGNHGRGVATNLSSREQVERAYAAAREESGSIMVEQHIQGNDYRLLVIGGKLVAAALREPAHVIGDGRTAIAQLAEEVNKDPRRSDGHSTSLSFIKLDTVGLGVLAEQGFDPTSIPPAGQRVLIRRNGNLSTGGTATDVTDRVHPEVAARAVDAARIVGLDIAGVDLVARDVSRPMEDQRAAVVEVNAGPGLRMHLEPSAGKPRPVGEVILDMLFPGGDTGRIPTVAVAGVNGKTTTTRLIAHLFRTLGRVVGMTCTDGIFIDDRCIERKDCSGPRSARTVLLNPSVQVAVLETARYGIIREGLGFDRCDVAVVTNIGEGDHLGRLGIDTPEQLAQLKQVVIESVPAEGTAVLNAADALVAPMAGKCRGHVAFFARDPAHPVISDHRSRGGRAVVVRAGQIVLAQGSLEDELIALTRIPATHQGRIAFQVENVLAATAAGWSMGLPLDSMRTALESFAGDARQVPGRFNIRQSDGRTIIVDYAHNATALAALVEALDQFEPRRRCLVFSGINRRDNDVVRMGEVIGAGFDRVILYQDRDNSERTDGELNDLLRRGFARGGRVSEVSEAPSEREAAELALRGLEPGDLLVLGVEAIDEALALVRARFS